MDYFGSKSPRMIAPPLTPVHWFRLMILECARPYSHLVYWMKKMLGNLGAKQTFYFYFLLQVGLLLGNVQILYDVLLSNFRPPPSNDGTLTVWANPLHPRSVIMIFERFLNTSYTCNIIATRKCYFQTTNVKFSE